jgi:hypothetical protein
METEPEETRVFRGESIGENETSSARSGLGKSAANRGNLVSEWPDIEVTDTLSTRRRSLPAELRSSAETLNNPALSRVSAFGVSCAPIRYREFSKISRSGVWTGIFESANDNHSQPTRGRPAMKQSGGATTGKWRFICFTQRIQAIRALSPGPAGYGAHHVPILAQGRSLGRGGRVLRRLIGGGRHHS